MKQAKGFTLIEMIVVIVVLGILAVTAIPKFMDVQKEARIATLQGVGGAIQSANGIVYGQAAIQGVDKSEDSQITFGEGDTAFVVKGNIKANKDNIDSVIDTDMKRYDVKDSALKDELGSGILVPVNADGNAGTPAAVVYTFQNLDSVSKVKVSHLEQNCHIYAYNAEEGSKLKIEHKFEGC